MKLDKTWLLGAGLLLPLAGCPSDDTGEDTNGTTSTTDDTTSTTAPTTTTDDTTTSGPGTDVTDDTTLPTTDGTDDTTTGPMVCEGIGGPNADGESCTSNDDCASGVCLIFTDVPINEDAVCGETPPDCSSRITGTVFDFLTREPLAGADVLVAAALQAATNPTGADPLAEGTSDAEGRIDTTSNGPIMAPIGTVALTSAGGYYLTATGVASPVDGGTTYEVGTGIHDLWAVPDTDLADWSTELGNDMAIDAALLPLGDMGGVVGLVRDGMNNPVTGATVASTDGGSGAIIRYLDNDGTFNEMGTTDTGIFIILDPALAEDFEVTSGGMVVGGGTAGSANGAIFTLIVNAG